MKALKSSMLISMWKLFTIQIIVSGNMINSIISTNIYSQKNRSYQSIFDYSLPWDQNTLRYCGEIPIILFAGESYFIDFWVPVFSLMLSIFDVEPFHILQLWKLTIESLTKMVFKISLCQRNRLHFITMIANTQRHYSCINMDLGSIFWICKLLRYQVWEWNILNSMDPQLIRTTDTYYLISKSINLNYLLNVVDFEISKHCCSHLEMITVYFIQKMILIMKYFKL